VELKSRSRSVIARTSVRTHLAIGFGCLVLLASAVTVYALVAVGDLQRSQEQTSGREVPYLLGLSDAALAAKSAANDERGLLLAGDEKFAQEARGRRAAESAGLQSARDHALTSSGRAAVDGIQARLDRFNQAQDQVFQL
jgi:methyl-accepting chemotaxis protein